MKTIYLSSLIGLLFLGINSPFDFKGSNPFKTIKQGNLSGSNTDIEVSYVDMTDFEISELRNANGSISKKTLVYYTISVKNVGKSRSSNYRIDVGYPGDIIENGNLSMKKRSPNLNIIPPLNLFESRILKVRQGVGCGSTYGVESLMPVDSRYRDLDSTNNSRLIPVPNTFNGRSLGLNCN